MATALRAGAAYTHGPLAFKLGGLGGLGGASESGESGEHQH